MRNIRLRLQYEGTRYQGWQKQTSTDNTIQGKMEVLLTKMCGEPVEIAASGRTDAGVHALGQVANFHTESDMSTEEIMAYCNRYLPEDIAVVEVSEAAPRFHSRLNAREKIPLPHHQQSDPGCVLETLCDRGTGSIRFGCYAKGGGAIAWRTRFQGIYLCEEK